MKLYGSLKELVSAVFRKDAVEITIRPNQATTYTAARDIQLPPKNGDAVLVSSGDIVNADIAAGAAIVDTKLATISTVGKVSNSATTAASTNTVSAIVARDGSGNFSAGTVTATSFSGPLTGNVTGNVSGTAGDITATSNSTLTTLSSLSLPGSQVSGNILGNAANVTGTVAIANGGTGQTTQQAALNALAGTQTANRVLRSDGTNTTLSQVGLTTDVTGTLPVANGGTGITSFGSGVATFLGTPSSANLASAVTDETGSGSLVFGTSPTLSSPQVNSSLVVQQIATPSNPSAGFDKLYTKSDGILYKLDSAGNEVAVGSGAGGSGEINTVTNPSAATDTTGWTAGTSHSVAKDVTNSPLNPIVPTSFGITSSAAVALGSQTSTSGVYDGITMPSGLQNRKLKVEFFFTTPASSSGTWAVAVYQGSTKVALSTDSSGDTILPSGVTGGKFTAYFDTTSSASYSLNLVQRTRSLSNALYITNVIVGPGIQPQGAVVGEWTNFTPVTFGATTYSSLTGRYRRVGDSAQIRISATINAASGTYWFDMPTSIGTIDTTKVRNGNYQDQYGVATYYNSPSVNYAGIVQKTNVANRVRIVGPNGGNEWSQSTNVPTTPAAGHGIELEFTVPIAEWAGSGTVQLAQNDVTYYYGTGGTWGTTATVTTGQGPGGVLGGTTTPGAAFFEWTIVPSTPIQTGSIPILELSVDGRNWGPTGFTAGATTTIENLRFDGTNWIGGGVGVNASGNIAIRWGKYAYGSVGTYTGTWYWRVKVASPGAAVGFGLYQPGVSAGLVSSSGLAGRADGNTIATGFVGEMSGTLRSGTGGFAYSTRSTTTLTTSPTPVISLTLNKGVYLISGSVNIASGVSANVSSYLAIGTTQVSSSVTASTTPGYNASTPLSIPIVISSNSTVVAIYSLIGNTTGLVVNGHELFAVRIA